MSRYSLNVTLPSNSSADIAINVKFEEGELRNAFAEYTKGEVLDYLRKKEARYLERFEKQELKSIKIIGVVDNIIEFLTLCQSGALYSETLSFTKLKDNSMSKVAKLQYHDPADGKIREIMKSASPEERTEYFEEKTDGWDLLVKTIKMQEDTRVKKAILEQQENN